MKHRLRLILNIVVPIAALSLIVVLLPRLLLFCIPFILGALIAWIANPMIRFLNTKTRLLEREHASAVIIVLMLILIGLLLYLIVSAGVRFCMQFAGDLPEMVRSLAQSVSDLIRSHQELFQIFMKTPLGEGIVAGGALQLDLGSLDSRLEDSLVTFATKISEPIANASISAVRSIPNVLVYSVVTIFSAFCFCKDGERYAETVQGWIPERFLRYFRLLKSDLRKIVQGWLLAQFKLMFFVFAVLLIGFLLLRVPYALPIAALTAFLDFLPMLGVGFIMWPWMLIELINGHPLQALWLLLIYLATQLVRQFMQPKIMGDTMGLSPFLTILFMYLGYRLYGFGGLIFAVPVGMLVMCFYRYGAYQKLLDSQKELCDELLSFL